ncbi:hypothetical protein 65p324 [Aeromonas phage 65]|uniref:Uncharacterized protein n=2 Tax=Ishigurovirus osborne TaxID=260149 RepID=A0A219YCF6_9CAUD|nr:hypothetical protein ST65p324 [Aeromonas phage 65]ADQ53332.1 hypothetical protein 65p324 [Aeromonas phage 65]APU01694.1 hypothetical protein [Aeromonas phage 65.2]
MKLTNVMPTKGNFIAVLQYDDYDLESEKWCVDENGVIQYWDSQDGWCVVDLEGELYSNLKIQFVVGD